MYEQLFTVPFWQVSYARPIQALEFPVNLAPQVSQGGDLVFELDGYKLIELAEPFDARVEIHDAVSGKMACFPAAIGTYRRRYELRPTTVAERVNAPRTAQPWHGVMGPPDPGP